MKRVAFVKRLTLISIFLGKKPEKFFWHLKTIKVLCHDSLIKKGNFEISQKVILFVEQI